MTDPLSVLVAALITAIGAWLAAEVAAESLCPDDDNERRVVH